MLFVYILFLVGTASYAQELDSIEAPQSAVTERKNKTDEDLEAYVKPFYHSWPKYKENLDKMPPRQKRASLISSYGSKSIQKTLEAESKDKGVLWEFKPNRGRSQEFFALNGNLSNIFALDVVYDFFKKDRLKDDKNPDESKENLEDLPTTGEIDALNEQIKDLPKKQMSFTKTLWMINPGWHLLTMHVRVEAVQKLMDALASVIGCFVVYRGAQQLEPFETIMITVGLPIIIPSALGWISLSLLDSVLISSKVLYYFLTGNLYVVDAKGIKLPTEEV